MQTANDSKLVTLIKVVPVILMMTFTLILVVFVLGDNKTRMQQLEQTLREEYLQDEHYRVQQRVDSLYQHIIFELNTTDNRLKQDIKSRVDEAYAMMMHIYEQNRDRPVREVQQRITEAVRPIRFNEGRGYFFIYTMQGVNVMHPLLPELEGKLLWNMRDANGLYIIRELVALLKKNPQGGYLDWLFPRPGDKENDWDKMGYVRYFEPYDWFIGTGEYVVDATRQIQDNILKRISSFVYDDQGYVFVMDMQGTVLAHHDDQYIGKRFPQAFQYFISQLNIKSHKYSGFVFYNSSYTPSGITSGQKESYIRLLPQWGWLLGSGVYLEKIDDDIAKQLVLLRQKNRISLYRMLGLCLVVALAMTLISLGAGRYISRRLFHYQARINDDFRRLTYSRDQLRYMASHDSLTSLPNRSQLESRIGFAIQESHSAERMLAVMFVDMDNFKKINDQHGHHVGDEFLMALSRRFKNLLSKGESVARFGGDEFVFCFPMLESVEQAQQKADLIHQAMDYQLDLNETPISTTCTIGVAMYPQDGEDPRSLISKADIVLFRSKMNHKGKTLFFDNQVHEQVQYDFKIEDELRHALSNNEIEIYYQPQIIAESGYLYSVEALCRWRSHVFGMVPTDRFIAIAETTGLIHSIGDFVIRRVCRDILAMDECGFFDLRVAINISPKQIACDGFDEHIAALVRNEGFSAQRITLEITENIFIEDVQKVRPVLDRLLMDGFQIALDDFGTGYSSLSYLNALPIKEIKIDRAFVAKLTSQRRSQNLIRSIIAIGHSGNMRVVAEGVETAEQGRILTELGCYGLQGYYFARPMPFDELKLWSPQVTTKSG